MIRNFWRTRGTLSGTPAHAARVSLLMISLAAFSGGATGVQGQATASDSVEVISGADYGAGGIRRFLLGTHYRDLWTTPIKVPYLNLGTFAGGLTPTSAHQGSQTTSLRFDGADGREYQFRNVYKTPTATLDSVFQGTLVADLIQDGASASHPLGSLIVSPLLAAAGVLHAPPVVAVMPDDPRLGEFRAQFAGSLGTIEERPNEADEEGGRGGFGTTLNVIGPDRLFERIDDGPEDQVDVPQFLTARLLDIMIGDRDRHRDNWRWALLDDSGPVRYWQPISRDHDEAFVKLDGLALSLATAYYPQLVSFGPEFDNLSSLNWHSREIDRRFLTGVDRAAWDSTATWIQGQLTDDVIERAVRELPEAMYAVGGADLEGAIKSRRDALGDAADEYYRSLAQEVEIHASNADEIAEITRVDDRFVDVTIRGVGFDDPYFVRRFDAEETKEIRINMWRGDDRVVVGGDGSDRIQLRIVGGSGADELVDASRAGHVRFYDAGDRTETELGSSSSIDSKPFEEWVGSDLDRYPPREWGSWRRSFPYVQAGPNFGVLLGMGVTLYRYGFRKSPYSSSMTIFGGLATGEGWGTVNLEADLRRTNSDVHWVLSANASGIDRLRYYGLGNDTEGGAATRFYQVEVNDFRAEPRLVVPLGVNSQLALGPSVRYLDSTPDDIPTLFNEVSDTLVGANGFGQVGGGVEIEFDTRDNSVAPTRGVLASLSGRVVPPMWDAEDSFGMVTAETRAYWSAPDNRIRPTLALRAGGEKAFGSVPFHEAAYLGGRSKLRGWDTERFAGDASLYGGAELRLFLARFSLMLPANFGVSGFADAGRVFADGESPGGWHTGVGGGIWIAFIDRANTVSLTIATSDERTTLYAGFGFAY